MNRVRDWTPVTILVVLAAGLRFWNLTGLGLTHFDEGSYAMTGKWLATLGEEGWAYEAGQAPGLFPTAVGLFFTLFGITDYVAVAVSAVAGSLTVGVLFLLARSWFGARVALGAAAFLATCEYHLIYSRLALTDATFVLLFWMALGSLYHAVFTGSVRWYLIGGHITGLCWNTKYHGVLPLLILGFWLTFLWAGRNKGSGEKPGQTTLLLGWSLAAAAALLTFLPWALAVASTVGWTSILQGQLDHSFGLGSVVVTRPETLLFYLRQWVSSSLLILALAGFLFTLANRRTTGLFLVTSTVLFLVASLFYLSFPRLILPVIPAVCLFAAIGAERICELIPLNMAWTFSLVTGAVILVNVTTMGQHGILTMRTDSYRQAALYLQDFSEPVVTQLKKNFYFYEQRKSLELRRHSPTKLNELLRNSPSVIIAIDPIVHRLPKWSAWLREKRQRLALLKSFEVQMYAPVYYQGFNPTVGFEKLPRSVAPSVPGKTSIDIYRYIG